QPFVPSIVPPTWKFGGAARHHTRGVSVPEPSIMPGPVVIDGPENRRADPTCFVSLTATDQRGGGHRIVIKVCGAMERPRFHGRIAGQEQRRGRGLVDQAREVGARRRFWCG